MTLQERTEQMNPSASECHIRKYSGLFFVVAFIGSILPFSRLARRLRSALRHGQSFEGEIEEYNSQQPFQAV